MKSCKVCRVEKAEEHFRKKGTRRSATCKACEADAETVRAPANEAQPGPALAVPPGYGFRVRSEDGRLIIEQDCAADADGETRTDTVILAPHEALQLLDWISTHAQEASRP